MSKNSVRLLKQCDDFARPGQKTIVVTGSSRGGTSMVAAVLRGLGVHMGTGLNNNHEDVDFYSILNDPLPDGVAFQDLVHERDRQFEVWGIKSPLFVDNQKLVGLLAAFRRLILIVVFRNPLANAASYQARDNAHLSESVLSIYEKLGQFLKTMLGFEVNLVGVIYEAAAQEPDAFVHDLAECLGLAASPSQVGRAVRSVSGDGGGYRNLPGEGWSATQLEPGCDDAVAAPPAELLTDFQSVIHSTRSFVFLGDIFDDHANLIIHTAAHAESLGSQIRLIVQSLPGTIGYDESVRYNLYLDLDGTFSLGVSILLEISGEPVQYAINSERPIRRLALGLASSADAGRQMPAANITVCVLGTGAAAHP